MVYILAQRILNTSVDVISILPMFIQFHTCWLLHLISNLTITMSWQFYTPLETSSVIYLLVIINFLGFYIESNLCTFTHMGIDIPNKLIYSLGSSHVIRVCLRVSNLWSYEIKLFAFLIILHFILFFIDNLGEDVSEDLWRCKLWHSIKEFIKQY